MMVATRTKTRGTSRRRTTASKRPATRSTSTAGRRGHTQTVRLSLLLPAAQMERIRKRARAKGISVSELVRECLG